MCASTSIKRDCIHVHSVGVSTLVQSAKRHHKIASCIGEAVIVHLVQCYITHLVDVVL